MCACISRLSHLTISAIHVVLLKFYPKFYQIFFRIYLTTKMIQKLCDRRKKIYGNHSLQKRGGKGFGKVISSEKVLAGVSWLQVQADVLFKRVYPA